MLQRLSEKFLDRDIECDEFLEKYMEERTKTHILKIKSEKLGEMIQQHVSHGTYGSSHNPQGPGYPGAQSGGIGDPPYPMYGGNSRMPSLHLPPVSN